MIGKCSCIISNWLFKVGVIQEEDRELYEYAAYSLMITLSPVFMAMLFGGLVGAVLESIILIIPFMVIRKYSGGYHAKNSKVCFLESSLILILCISGSVYLEYDILHILTLLVSTLSLIICSPIDSDNRRLEEFEKRIYKRQTAKITLIFLIISLGLYIAQQSRYAICVSIGVILSAGLQLPCVITRIRNKLVK